MSIATAILTPTVTQNSAGRIGIAVYDNPNVTNNYNKSVFVLYGDSTWREEKRADLTVVPNTLTGPAAWSYFAGSNQSMGPGN